MPEVFNDFEPIDEPAKAPTVSEPVAGVYNYFGQQPEGVSDIDYSMVTDNPFDIDAAVAVFDGNVGRALDATVGIDPKTEIELNKLAKGLNVPQGIISYDKEYAAAKYKAKQIYDVLTTKGDDGLPKYPVAAKFLSEPDRMAAMRDPDVIRVMAKVEEERRLRSMGKISSGAAYFYENAVKGLPNKVIRAGAAAADMTVDVGDVILSAQESINRRAFIKAGLSEEEADKAVKESNLGYLRKIYDDAGWQVGEAAKVARIKAKDWFSPNALPRASGKVGQLALDAIGSVDSVALSVLASAYAAPVYGIAALSAYGLGDIYEQEDEEHGEVPGFKLTMTALRATTNGVLEYIGGRVGLQGASIASKGATDIARGVAIAGVGEGAEEIAQGTADYAERLTGRAMFNFLELRAKRALDGEENLSNIKDDYIASFGEEAGDIAYSGAIGTVLGVGVGSVGGLNVLRGISQAKEMHRELASTYLEVSALIKSGADPAKAAEFIKDIDNNTEAGGIKVVVPGNILFQEAKDSNAEGELESRLEDMGIQKSDEMTMSLGELSALTADNPKLLEAISSKIKPEGGSSIEELSGQSATIAASVEKNIATLYNDVDAARLHPILVDMKKTLRDTGYLGDIKVNNKKEADALVSVWHYFAKQMAQSTNLTYDEVIESINPKVTTGEDIGARGQIELEGFAAVIRLGKDADLTTFLHESAHAFYNFMENVSDSPDITVDERFTKSFNALREYAGGDAEKIGAAFENYLNKGVSPKQALIPAFTQFREWMNNVYENAVVEGAEITQEVQDAFDSWLAEEAEVQAAMDALKLSEDWGEVWKERVEDREKRRQAALAQRAADKANAAFIVEDEKESVYKRAVAMADLNPVYNFLEFLTSRRLKLDGESVKDFAGDEVLVTLRGKRLIGRPKGSNTVTYLEAMNLFNMSQPKDMLATADFLKKVSLAKPRGVAIENYSIQILENMTSDIVKNLGNPAINATTTEAMSTKLDAINIRLGLKVERRQSVNAAKVRRNELEKAFNGAIVKGVSLNSFNNRIAILSDKVNSLIEDASSLSDKAGDNPVEQADAANAWERAKKAQEEQIMLMEEARVARNFREEFTREMNRFRKLNVKPKKDATKSWNHMALVQRILLSAGIITETAIPNIDAKATNTLMEEVVAIAKEYGKLIDPLVVFSGEYYQDMTVGKFRALSEVISIIEAQGGKSVRDAKTGERVSLDSVVDKCLIPLLAKPKKVDLKTRTSFLARLRKYKREALSWLVDLQTNMVMADGEIRLGEGMKRTDAGANESLAIRVFDAHGKYKKALNDVLEGEIAPQMEVLSGFVERNTILGSALAKTPPGLRVPKVFTDNTGNNIDLEGWTADSLLMVVLNSGNPGGYNALTDEKGLAMTEAEVDMVRGMLTYQELEAVQKIWDAMDALFPAANETLFRTQGIRAEAVESLSFTANTLDGKEITLRGGYMPLKYDKILSRGFEKVVEAENVTNTRTTAVVKDKSMIARTGAVFPLALNINTIQNSISDTLKLTYLTEPMADFEKVIRDDRWAEAYISRMGKESYDSLIPLLNNVIDPSLHNAGTVTQLINKFKRAAGARAFVGNVASGSKQVLSLISAGEAAGWEVVGEGLNQWKELGVSGAIEFVREHSSVMASRGGSFEVGAGKALDVTRYIKMNRIQKYVSKATNGRVELTSDEVIDLCYALVRVGDIAGAYTPWLGEYSMSIREGRSEEEAVSRADDLVRRTQPDTSELSATLAKMGGKQKNAYLKELYWMAMPFHGWLSKILTRQLMHVSAYRDKKISAGQLVKFHFMEMILPAIIGEMVTSAVWEHDLPELRDYVYAISGSPLMGMPVLNQIASSMKYGRDVELNFPIFSAGSRVLEGGRKLADNWSMEEAFVSFTKILDETGLPARTAATRAENLIKGRKKRK